MSTAWRDLSWMRRLAGWLVLSVAGGLVPVVVAQVESRFADEEFFAAVQAGVLAGLSGLLFLTVHLLGRGECARVYCRPCDWRVVVPRWVVVATIVLVSIGGGRPF